MFSIKKNTHSPMILCFMLNLILLLTISSGSIAQFHPDTKWISPSKHAQEENQWFIFRKSYDLSEPLKTELVAKISADSKYWLYINDQLVVFEGQLKRGPTPDDTYYDEIDITPFIRQGENSIAIMLWFWGRDGFCHKNSGMAGLLFEAINPQVRWMSDANWKYARCESFADSGEPKPNYRLPEFNIHYIADSKYDGWMKGEYDDSDFLAVVEQGTPGCSPWNKLWKRPFPQWKDSGLVSYENKLSMPLITDGNMISMKLPVNYSITPYFKIYSPDSGLFIDIRTDNYKGGSEYNVRTEYITKRGVQEFETFGYMNGHEVLYSFPPGIKVLDLKYRRTSFPSSHIGSFTCDDPFLNTLWQKSLNTMDLNMRDAIQDADRERSQWWGDAVIVMGEIFYTCDKNGISIIQKAISNLVEWQRPDGSLYSPVPSGSWFRELPQQMLASIGKYGFWNYYRYTGDSAFIAYVYPHVSKYLSLWKMQSGLVIHRPGSDEKNPELFWDWTDWGADVDVPLCENAWYYMALESAANMSELLGDLSSASKYRKQMALLKEGFNSSFWTGEYYRSPGYQGKTDDRGNGLAVVAGLADKAKWISIKKLLDTTFQAGPYLEKYILESYFLMEDEKAGIERMKKRYKQMTESPITTLWEGWEVSSFTFGGGSYNHGWSGGVLTLMSQYVAGIQPGEDGFSTVLIKPQMGDLNFIECSVPHSLGLIVLKISRSQKGRVKAEITLPPEMKGIFQWGETKIEIQEGTHKIRM